MPLPSVFGQIDGGLVMMDSMHQPSVFLATWQLDSPFFRVLGEGNQ